MAKPLHYDDEIIRRKHLTAFHLFCGEISLRFASDGLGLDLLRHGDMVNDVGSIYCVDKGRPVKKE